VPMIGIALGQMLMYYNVASLPQVQAEVDLDNINFVDNDRLLSIMQGTSATPKQVTEVVRINSEARLRALKIGLLIMAGLSLLAIVPVGRLPDYKPGEIPANLQPEPLARDAMQLEPAPA